MKIFGDFLTFIARILLLYLASMICRIVFLLYNAELIGSFSWEEIPSLLKGSLIFDSGSIFYINLPFLLFSLLPFRFRSKKAYQRALLWLFVSVNSIGLAINLADVFYYPYKMARIASDDFHFLTNGNFGALLWSFFQDFWYGIVIWAGLTAGLWWGFKKIGYRKASISDPLIYYPSQAFFLAFAAAAAVVLIRGGNISKATFPINVNDASLYASPEKASLVLSNPFAVIRTSGHKVHYPRFYPEESLEDIFSPIHSRPDSSSLKLEGHPNIVLIILESFGSAHIKALSDQFPPEQASYTPFLDSLMQEGYLFTNTFHNGIRSIDALPSLWASIPTFKTQFLSLPQSSAPKYALGQILSKEMGYTTAFLHGAVRQSMSFVAFARTVGVEHSVSQEDYEEVYGHKDFDGKWGIWDHKFLPFAARKIGELPQPFFATLFTLSSHHPFQLPEEYVGKIEDGTMDIHRMIRYSDKALREFFRQMRQTPGYENTLFILTADHCSGADNEKYRRTPYNFSVPLLFYTPSGALRGRNDRVAQQIDLMPTLLGLLGYEKPYFAFGQDLFSEKTRKDHFAINYLGGSFNAISDSLVWIFNEREVSGVYNYKKDALQKENLLNADEKYRTDSTLIRARGFVQQYYKHIKDRDFTIPSNPEYLSPKTD